MRNKFLDVIQLRLDKIKYSSYKRIDESILWVGTNDKDVNRTIDFSLGKSINIQIGNSINYFVDEETIEERVLRIFIKALFSEIKETLYYKGNKLIKTKYELDKVEGFQEFNIVSIMGSLFNSEIHDKITKHHPILDEESHDFLLQELDKEYKKI